MLHFLNSCFLGYGLQRYSVTSASANTDRVHSRKIFLYRHIERILLLSLGFLPSPYSDLQNIPSARFGFEILKRGKEKIRDMVEQIEDKYQKQLGKKMIHFLKYFPVRIKNVGMDAIMARKLIWNFKDGNDNAYEVVAEMTASKLVDEYGDEVKDMVLVCVPASSQSLNEKRFKLYCEKVSDLCSIHNGYEHIKILSSRAAVHEKNRKKDKSREEQTINVDADYFKGKDVVVMDDVVTTGLSYAKFADKLEEYGANVLGGLFLGRTSYKYV